MTFPEQEYSTGVHRFALNDIPANRNGLRFALTRVNWPNSPVKVRIIASDGSKTWDFSPALFPGGISHNRRTDVETESFVRWEWPGIYEQNEQNIRRVIRITEATIEIELLKPIRTAVTLETF